MMMTLLPQLGKMDHSLPAGRPLTLNLAWGNRSPLAA